MARTVRISRKWRRCGGALVAVGLMAAGPSLLAAAGSGPSLGAARSFAILANSTVTNTGNTVVTGDLGVFPGTTLTGFPPGVVTGGSVHLGDTEASNARTDAVAAYTALAALSSDTDLSGTDLGGLTLTPGVYTFSAGAGLTGDLVLDAQCDDEALFVFQIGSTLITETSATVTVINGGWDYDESNVFWQVGSSATLGAGTAFVGHIVARTSISMGTGTTMVGNALALDGAVSLDANDVLSPPVVVDDSTMLFTPDWTHITDNKTSGADLFRISGTYAYSGPVASIDGVIDPATDGIVISVTVFGEATARSVTVAADDPNWRVTEGGTLFHWVGTGTEGEPWKITIDEANLTFNFWSGKFDLNPGDGSAANWGAENGGYIVPVDIEVITGNDSAHDHACYRNSLGFNATRNWGVLRIP